LGLESWCRTDAITIGEIASIVFTYRKWSETYEIISESSKEIATVAFRV